MKRLQMEIMFDDLNYDAQKHLLKEAGVAVPEDMDWDEIPVAVVEFEKEEHGSEDDLMEAEFLDDTYGFDSDGSLD